MTRGQRRVLGAVGCLLAVVLLGWVAAAAGGDDGARSGSESSARGSRSTATTLPLVPVTGGEPLPPTTSAPPPVPMPSPAQIAAAVPSTTTPGQPPPAALSGEGALLVRPKVDSTRPVDKAAGCRSANDPGWRIVDCGALRRDDAVLLWVVQSRGSGLRALVLRERTAGQWVPVLAAADDDGSRWERIGVRGEDVSGDGRPDLVFGFHLRNAEKSLAVDVVDAPGSVGLHRLLPAGAVRAEKGALHGWARLADGSYEHAAYRVIAGAWRLGASERVARDAVPPSMI